MHLIPQVWAHLHILVSVFPTVGLVFALGIYIAAIIAKSEAMKKTSLVFIGMLGLVGIPTYLSGVDSVAELAGNPKFTDDTVANHLGWGIAALGALGLTGLAAWIALLRFGRKPLSDNAVHLVLGLGLVTLGLMALVGELGWEINHTEIFLPTAKTPQLWSHVHIILNHFPTVGFVFSVGLYALALLLNNTVMKRTISSAVTLLRHTLLAFGEEPPQDTTELFRRIEATTQADAAAFAEVHAYRDAAARHEDPFKAYDGYMRALEKVIVALDGMVPKREWQRTGQ